MREKRANQPLIPALSVGSADNVRSQRPDNRRSNDEPETGLSRQRAIPTRLKHDLRPRMGLGRKAAARDEYVGDVFGGNCGVGRAVA